MPYKNGKIDMKGYSAKAGADEKESPKQAAVKKRLLKKKKGQR
jgi:hypothetical protein